MNFFDDEELAQRFRNDQVPSRERFFYFLSISLVTAFLGTSLFISWTYAELDRWLIASDVLILAITGIGTAVCYRTNRSGDDREFIERFMCIGWPVLMQMLLLFFLLILVVVLCLLVASFFFASVEDLLHPIFNPLGVVLVGGYFYWRLNSSMKIAAGIG